MHCGTNGLYFTFGLYFNKGDPMNKLNGGESNPVNGYELPKNAHGYSILLGN